MADREMPPVSILRQVLDYDPKTGFLYWRPRPESMFSSGGKRTVREVAQGWNKRYARQRALYTHNSRNALFGGIFGQTYLAHRVAWTIYHGAHPQGVIDHINGDGTDNRIINLRDVTFLENTRNTALHKNNQSGVSGVDWRERDKVWRVRVGGGNRRITIGYFRTKEEAVEARMNAEISYGFHANHGKRERFRKA